MEKKPANAPRGRSMNPEEQAVPKAAEKESWITKLLRNTRLAKGRPDQDKKPR